MDIQTLLQNHSFEVQGLLRKHKISGDLCVDTINKAYNAKGEQFMMELLRIITPTSSFLGIGKGNGFLGLGKKKDESETTTDTATDVQVKDLSSQPETPGKFWTFWDNLLGTVSKTGEVIGGLKTATQPLDNSTVAQMTMQQETSKSNMLYLVAGGFVFLIVIILIFKK